MQLSEKQKTFSHFLFFGVLKSILNFNHLPKNDGHHTVISDTGSEKDGYINV